MEKKKDINIVISNILKTGVFISSFFIITGIVLSFIYGVDGVLTIERYTFSEMLKGLTTLNYHSYLIFVNINSSTENLWIALCLY